LEAVSIEYSAADGDAIAIIELGLWAASSVIKMSGLPLGWYYI
jgi:hypothetical protein